MAQPSFADFNPPERVLMGPGPSNVHPRVQRAMTAPLLGHLDPEFLKLMDDTMALLRYVFQTQNRVTFPISGTGSAGMEAAFVNLIEPGDVAVIGVNGLFGQRMVEVAARCGASVVPIEAEWGDIVAPEAIEAALRSQAKVKLLALVHAETSTGALQPLAEAGRLAQEYDALFLVDTVTSLGGCEVTVDDWGIDFAYSGTQKCLSCPPGLAPVTISQRAMEAIARRQSKVQSWYLDVGLLESYWGSGRIYHHTAPVLMNYALREALRIIAEEGLQARFERHQRHGAALQAGLEAMGLGLHVAASHRLPMLTALHIPEGVDDQRVRRSLLQDCNIEIGGGLGALRGRIWRVGLMGHSSTAENVLFFLAALERVLGREGWKTEPGSGVAAALPILSPQATLWSR